MRQNNETKSTWKSNKNKKKLEELENLRRITYIPYPQIINSSDNRNYVNTAHFSKEVLEKFKEVIRNFVNEEKEKLTKEFDEL